MTVADLKVNTSMTLGAFALGATHTEMHLAIAYAVALAEATRRELSKPTTCSRKPPADPTPPRWTSTCSTTSALGLLGLARRCARRPQLRGPNSNGAHKDNPEFIKYLNAGLLINKVWALIGTGSPEEALRATPKAA